ncbi:hypothetical protein P2318_31135 [Myxococcaceae bacterium GXIMD 01537]
MNARGSPAGRSLALLAGLAVLLLAGVGAWLWLRARPAPAPTPGVDPSAEARIQVLHLCDAARQYHEAHGTYLPAGPTPAQVPQGHAVPWPHDARFEALGFEPGPAVHFQYEVAVHEDPVGAPEVVCLARGDLDGDGLNSLFRVTLDAQGQTSAVHAEREGE